MNCSVGEMTEAFWKQTSVVVFHPCVHSNEFHGGRNDGVFLASTTICESILVCVPRHCMAREVSESTHSK